MSYLIALNFVILGLLSLLVVGLLRAYAETVRRLHELELGASAVQSADAASGTLSAASSVAAEVAGEVGSLAPAISGHRPSGGAVTFDLASGRQQPTLIAFLSAGCVSCGDVWEALGDQTRELSALGIDRVVAVTKGPKDEDPIRVQRLAGEFREVVMSGRAHRDYGVDVTPFFVLVDPDGRVTGSGSAQSWSQMLQMIKEATADEAYAARLAPKQGIIAFLRRNRLPRHRAETPSEQLHRGEAELAVAGIGAGHASLHPDRNGTDDV